MLGAALTLCALIAFATELDIDQDCGKIGRGKIGCKYTYHKGFAISGPTVKSLSTKTECECQRLCDEKIACVAITFASSRSAGTSAAYQSGSCILKSASKRAAHGHINKFKNLDVYIKDADCPNNAAPAIRCPIHQKHCPHPVSCRSSAQKAHWLDRTQCNKFATTGKHQNKGLSCTGMLLLTTIHVRIICSVQIAIGTTLP